MTCGDNVELNDLAPEVQDASGEQPQAEAGAPEDDLAAQLEQARQQSQEYLEGWQRARAELANARRRFEKERAEAHQYAQAELMRKLLPISDDFERALSAIPDDKRGESWVEGVSMIYQKMHRVFEAIQVTPIVVQPGDHFDPTLHEALTQEASEKYQSDQIIAEVQKGYRLGDYVLRPSLVRVAQ